MSLLNLLIAVLTMMSQRSASAEDCSLPVIAGFQNQLATTNERFFSEFMTGVTNFGLELILSRRCTASGFVALSDRMRCKDAAEVMARELDFNSGKYSTVVFAKEFKSLLSSKEVRRYLLDLHAYLESNASKTGTANLWDYTLEHTQGDKEKALRWIAVLFQSPYDDANVKYLADKAIDHDSMRTLSALQETTKLLSSTRVMSYYPTPIQVGTRSHYHFYVIGHLSQQLKRAGLDQEMAILLPYLFNSSYESMKQAARLRGGDLHSQLKAVMTEPTPEEPSNQNRNLFENTYLGYAGATWAVKENPKLIGNEDFVALYSKSPRDFTSRLIQSLK